MSLCILTVRIFCIELVFSRTTPRQQVVITTIGHTIITNTHDFVLLVHDTCSDLRGRETIEDHAANHEDTQMT